MYKGPLLALLVFHVVLALSCFLGFAFTLTFTKVQNRHSDVYLGGRCERWWRRIGLSIFSRASRGWTRWTKSCRWYQLGSVQDDFGDSACEIEIDEGDNVERAKVESQLGIPCYEVRATFGSVCIPRLCPRRGVRLDLGTDRRLNKLVT